MSICIFFILVFSCPRNIITCYLLLVFLLFLSLFGFIYCCLFIFILRYISVFISICLYLYLSLCLYVMSICLLFSFRLSDFLLFIRVNLLICLLLIYLLFTCLNLLWISSLSSAFSILLYFIFIFCIFCKQHRTPLWDLNLNDLNWMTIISLFTYIFYSIIFSLSNPLLARNIILIFTQI